MLLCVLLSGEKGPERLDTPPGQSKLMASEGYEMARARSQNI